MTQTVDSTSSQNGAPSQWHMKTLEVLLASTATCIRRARYVFTAIVIAGSIVIVAQFNATIPWLRNVMERGSTKPEVAKCLNELRFSELALVRIPLLGLTFSVYDLAILGALGMAVLSVWYYYALRRENHSVGCVVCQAKSAVQRGSREEAMFLWYGIAHEFVYTTAPQGDCPVGERPRRGARAALRILQFMPAWVPISIICADLFTLFVPHKLYSVTVIEGPRADLALWFNLSTAEQVEVSLRTAFATAVALFAFVQCLHAIRFDTGTREQLVTLEALVRPPLAGGSDGQLADGAA